VEGSRMALALGSEDYSSRPTDEASARNKQPTTH